MRVSVNKGDPGYENYEGPHQKPYLNGICQSRCFTADEEEGYVEVYAIDINGDYIIEGGCVKTERLYGKVEVRSKTDKQKGTSR
jgi:hypothetical protein